MEPPHSTGPLTPPPLTLFSLPIAVIDQPKMLPPINATFTSSQARPKEPRTPTKLRGSKVGPQTPPRQVPIVPIELPQSKFLLDAKKSRVENKQEKQEPEPEPEPTTVPDNPLEVKQSRQPPRHSPRRNSNNNNKSKAGTKESRPKSRPPTSSSKIKTSLQTQKPKSQVKPQKQKQESDLEENLIPDRKESQLSRKPKTLEQRGQGGGYLPGAGSGRGRTRQQGRRGKHGGWAGKPGQRRGKKNKNKKTKLKEEQKNTRSEEQSSKSPVNGRGGEEEDSRERKKSTEEVSKTNERRQRPELDLDLPEIPHTATGQGRKGRKYEEGLNTVVEDLEEDLPFYSIPKLWSLPSYARPLPQSLGALIGLEV